MNKVEAKVVFDIDAPFIGKVLSVKRGNIWGPWAYEGKPIAAISVWE